MRLHFLKWIPIFGSIPIIVHDMMHKTGRVNLQTERWLWWHFRWCMFLTGLIMVFGLLVALGVLP